TAYRLPFAATILPMRALLPMIVCALLVAGCGYKGPLYLPKPKSEASKPTPKPAPEQDQKKSEGP
ncbi:MAG TPA: lipoprotein, partial [Burkholderiales bacterium]|nr:lipoprotein [Burkholderiales bacterium]